MTALPIPKAGVTMDSREIAELTGKEHRNVCRDIATMLAGISDGPEGVLRFEHTYTAANGMEYRCYALPAHELMLLLTGYSVALRDKVLRRWEELEAKAPAIPEGSHLLALAVLEADRMIKEKDARIAILEPKAAVADIIALACDGKTISDVGKINGIGPHKLGDLLETCGILFRNANGDRIPYQAQLDAGRFIVKERVFSGSDGLLHRRSQTYVTGKGEVWIAEKFCRKEVEA